MSTAVEIRLTLSPGAAAGLKRFAEKVTHYQAAAVLYPHVRGDVRSEQAYEILEAFSILERTLADAGVASWPWIETGAAA